MMGRAYGFGARLNRCRPTADVHSVDASAYAFTQGLRSTRVALLTWRRRPWTVLRTWLLGSLATAALLLLAIWVIALITAGTKPGVTPSQPPFAVGGPGDVARILVHNLLVLALHAMACVAGFIAGSSLPLQARYQTGLNRMIHERGRAVALACVVAATTFSLSMQAYSLGTGTAQVAAGLHVPAGLVLLGLLPHAVPELAALFLPLAAWIIASRRREWDRLLAATLVTTSLAIPTLVLAALWEVYVAPHLLAALLGY
jgi:hypothetical protein